MDYNEGGTGIWIGFEQITGTIQGRSGSFVMQYNGTFDDTRVLGTCTVIPGAVTGELKGLTGNGQLKLEGHQERYPIDLDFSFT